jgi:hypothetical protein
MVFFTETAQPGILDHTQKKVGLNDVRRRREEWAQAKMLVPDQA